MLSFVRRNPASAYFILTFAISWGMVLLAVWPGDFPGTASDFASRLVPVVAAMLLGPSIAGFATMALAEGREGLRRYAAHLVLWRVPGAWYTSALLIAPVTVATVLAALSLTSRAFVPGVITADNPVNHILVGLMTGLAAGLFEELGWTGVAIPALRQRFSSFATGLIVGLIWSAWHLITSYWGGGLTSGGLPMALYLPIVCFSFLPPYRILMVRMFDRTPSLPLAMLMHAALTASVRIFDPQDIAGIHLVTYQLTFGGALWVLVGIGFLRKRPAPPQRVDECPTDIPDAPLAPPAVTPH